MADYNKEKIQIYDGGGVDLTFQFNNVTRAESRAGETYYQFQCEDGRFTCNNYCLRVMQQAWPGRGGRMHVLRKDETTYIISDVVMGDGGELGMQQWIGSGFAPVPLSRGGLDEAPPGEKRAAKITGDEDSDSEPKPVAVVSEGETLEDLSSLMSDCLKESFAIWANHSPDQVDIPGDVAGAIERICVSLYIDSRKNGITGMPSGDWSLPEEEAQVRVHVDGGELVENPPPLSDAHDPGIEDDKELPF